MNGTTAMSKSGTDISIASGVINNAGVASGTIASGVTFPTGHVIQTKWSLFAGSTAFNDNYNPAGVNITSVAITLSAGSDVIIFGLAEHERLSATNNHV
ncbi:MAG: hypothetical protein QF535_13945, partial [Anaerolineales bacterium]|nr:hypothetical protein [Anaerolineales bacterium]